MIIGAIAWLVVLVPGGRDPDELSRRPAVQGHRPPGAREPEPRRHQRLSGARLEVRHSGRPGRRWPRVRCPCGWPARCGPDIALFPLYCGVAAVVGHVFSVFVGMSGGKGVATASGVVLALAPKALLAVARRLGGCSSGSPATCRWGASSPRRCSPSRPICLEGARGGVLIVETALAAFLVWKHRANLRRLVRRHRESLRSPRSRRVGEGG